MFMSEGLSGMIASEELGNTGPCASIANSVEPPSQSSSEFGERHTQINNV